MSLYLAAYDISEDRRRNRVARFLLQYGSRLQKSVYEVYLDPEELPEFRRMLGAMLDARDEFAIVPVDERGQRKTVSWQRPLSRYEPVVLL